MSYETILYDLTDGIAEIRLNRPQRLNAVTQQLYDELNDALTRRIIQLALETHDLSGVDFGWMAFGSEGRHEQTLSTDQDNGIIWRCPEWEKPAAIRSRLIEFAKDVNATVSEQMNEYGFTLVSTLITKIALPAEVNKTISVSIPSRRRPMRAPIAKVDTTMTTSTRIPVLPT